MYLGRSNKTQASEAYQTIFSLNHGERHQKCTHRGHQTLVRVKRPAPETRRPLRLSIDPRQSTCLLLSQSEVDVIAMLRSDKFLSTVNSVLIAERFQHQRPHAVVLHREVAAQNKQ